MQVKNIFIGGSRQAKGSTKQKKPFKPLVGFAIIVVIMFILAGCNLSGTTAKMWMKLSPKL